MSTFSKTDLQGFGFFTFDAPQSSDWRRGGLKASERPSVVRSLGSGEQSLCASWECSNVSYYMSDLSVIASPEHFDYLKDNYAGFAGVKDAPDPLIGEGSTHEAIFSAFAEEATRVASALVEDLNADEAEAMFAHAITVNIGEGQDYDSGLLNRNLYLVKGYDPVTHACDGVGVINVEWRLRIENYKNKKSSTQKYRVDTTVRASLYGNLQELKSEVAYVKAHFKDKMFYRSALSIPYPSSEVSIYDALPDAGIDAYIHGVPLSGETNDYADAAVFYGADLENIGCIDNLDAQCATTYSKTITSGVSYATQETMSTGFTFAAGTEIMKAEFSFSLEVSFSNQWSEEQSETVSFEIPGNAKAYLYQGIVKSKVLRMFKKTGEFAYVDEGTFRTNLITTTDKPILGNAVTVKRRDDAVEEPSLWESI